MSHLRLVPPSQPPFEAEMFAFCRIGDEIFICFEKEWDLALPGRKGFEALKTWLVKFEPMAENAEPLPWPISPNGAA